MALSLIIKCRGNQVVETEIGVFVKTVFVARKHMTLFPKDMEDKQPMKMSSVLSSGQRKVLIFGKCSGKFERNFKFHEASLCVVR